jgi:hypothetical protein
VGPGLESIDAKGNAAGDLVIGWTEVYDDQEGYRDEAVKSMFVPRGADTPRPIKTWAHQDNCWMHAALIGVGIDANSNATVAWTQCQVDGSQVELVQTARRLQADGAWGAPETVAAARGFGAQLAVNAHGTAMLLMNADVNGNLVAYRRPPGGDFGAASEVTPVGVHTSSRTVMTLAPTSDATVLYSRYQKHPVYSTTFEP